MKPLCVDLDGTLIKGDALWEQTLQLLRTRPAVVIEMLGWLIRGKAFFKEQMARQPMRPMGPEMFNAEIVDWIRSEAKSGREVRLVTAAHRTAAAAAAAYCDCFRDVSSSTAERNLSGENKAALLRELYGAGGFDYAGNSTADLPAWRDCDVVAAVRTRPSLTRRLRKMHPKTSVYLPLPPFLFSASKSLRPQQLVKNLLLFLPLLLAHRGGEMGLLARAALGFLAFSLAASFGYCVNDLFDMPADRLDPRKSRRPLAAGELSPASGFLLAGAALFWAMVAALALPPAFRAAVAVYVVLTPLYSMVLKTIIGVDVLALTGLYVLRVLAGGLAAGVPVSQWLLTFSLFLFLSLSLLKRFGELLLWKGRLGDEECMPGRAYQLRDLEAVRAFGTASACVSVLVFILFVNTPGTQLLYPFPELLWCIGVLLAYWMNRLWMLAGRGGIPGDPIPFIVRDRVSWGVAAAALLLAIGAAILHHGT